MEVHETRVRSRSNEGLGPATQWNFRLNEAIAEGIRRIEDIATGRVRGLTEEQYRAALG